MRGTMGRVCWLGALAFVGGCGEARGTLVTTGAGGAWPPAAGVTWQIQLAGALDTTVQASLYDVDGFDTPPAAIDALHAAGRRVICYVSVGTHEPWRDDAAGFPAAALGNAVAGYPSERWLDTSEPTVRALMAARLDVAARKGCDGVDLSNVSPEGADTGFAVTAGATADYARFLAGEARRRRLAVGLGGGSDLAPSVEADFDWALTEGCLAAGDCAAYAGFMAAGKVVFAVEIGTAADAPTICPAARRAGVDALIKNRTYDAFRVPCP